MTNAIYYAEHKDEINEYRKQYSMSHPEYRERQLAYNRQYAEKNREAIIAYHQTDSYKQKNRDRVNKWNYKLKVEVLTHYGNGVCACVKCGFSDIRALSIDHIEGNGAEHRRELLPDNPQRGGLLMYSVLKHEGFPIGMQTLCMNCQFIKRAENKEWKPPIVGRRRELSLKKVMISFHNL